MAGLIQGAIAAKLTRMDEGLNHALLIQGQVHKEKYSSGVALIVRPAETQLNFK